MGLTILKRIVGIALVLSLALPSLALASASEPESRRIVVSCADNTVAVFCSNGAAEQLEKVFLCSVGPDTPGGTFYTSQKYLWRYLYGDVYGQYATRITGDILFHSVPYVQQDPATLEYEEYNKLGTPASLGCVRLRVCDAKWIYDHCPLGTQVSIQAESFDGAIEKPVIENIDFTDELRRNWDPTDPRPENPWRNEQIYVEGEKAQKVTRLLRRDTQRANAELWLFQGKHYASWSVLQPFFSLFSEPALNVYEKTFSFELKKKSTYPAGRTDILEPWRLVLDGKGVEGKVLWIDGTPYFSVSDIALLFGCRTLWNEQEEMIWFYQ